MPDHNLIVTPDNSPDRFSEDEADYFRRGLCGEIVEDGNWRGIIRCGRPSMPGASFGNCAEHNERMLECHYPDGTPRR